MNRVFYVVQPRSQEVLRHLNALRLLCDPAENKTAHITVRGPYSEALPKSQQEALSMKVAGATLEIGPPRTFFNADQNTVYLKCDCEVLSSVWDKPDYDYQPHLTIYDGEDRGHAERILRVLRHSFNVICDESTGLIEYPPAGGRNHSMLQDALSGDLLSRTLRIPLNPSQVESTPLQRRYSLMARLCQRLSTLARRPAKASGVQSREEFYEDPSDTALLCQPC